MQNILQDALGLLVVGNQLVTDYGNNVPEARRLLDSFFQIPPNGGLNAQQQNAISSESFHFPRSAYVAFG